ncbi:putative ATP-binding protein [Limnobacter sp. 130]|uniref:hypothetical protein n=1 Tax=Limnobacter sp. 130 TaxID=2653147 RepID=UPI0012F2AD2F|nr:hypothetical protein [Limnobacter sp. 130]VWX37423.1 putative ATP-binding protein [Limnobacter sp. 130]
MGQLALERMGVSSLFDEVRINPQYQRSVNLKHDFGVADSFGGFICHQSAQVVVETLAKQISSTSQRAFTITGPYGGGKSTLLNLLASSVCRKADVRDLARRKLDKKSLKLIDQALPCGLNGWSVLTLVGSRSDLVPALLEAVSDGQARGFCLPLRRGRTKDVTGIEKFLDWLSHEASSNSSDGVMIVIDEMGKFLEGAAQGEGDLLAFQTLAEAVSRMSGRVVLVGALHQAISAYSTENLDEWRKVQGRFADIPLVTKTDEVVEMIGQAISHQSPGKFIEQACLKIANLLRLEKPALRSDYPDVLVACSPFHPITASLLGPVSRRQYGQNERSIFSFLSTPDTHSFSDFLLKQPPGSDITYTPANFWDYLRANLDPAISASSDSHRWATAVDCVERAEARVNEFSLSLVKNVAVIDLFKKVSSIPPTLDVIATLYAGEQQASVVKGLNDLCEKRILTFRRHQEAYAVFEGSDFDIDLALKESRRKFQRPDLDLVAKFFNTSPVVAKRHYLEKGTLRWLSTHLVFLDDLQDRPRKLKPESGFGELVVVLPSNTTASTSANRDHVEKAIQKIAHPVLAFTPQNSGQINSLAMELMALQDVQTSAQELHGDSVARREVSSRISDVAQKLESALLLAFNKAVWVSNRDMNLGRLAEMASSLADREFPSTPVVFNELVNRDSLSTNAVKARKLLLYAMEKAAASENLGFEGFPAERGLYESILKGKIHVQSDDKWIFQMPKDDDSEDPMRLNQLWLVLKAGLGTGQEIVPVEAVYDRWALPPYGIRLGLMPILLHAMLMANRKEIALYRDGVFCTDFKEAYIDEFLAKPKRFGLRTVDAGADKALKEKFATLTETLTDCSELMIARELVRRVLALPKLILQTDRLTTTTRLIRDAIKNANDPHELINQELPEIIGAKSNKDFSETLNATLVELEAAFGNMLSKLEASILTDLEVKARNFERLKLRASKLQGRTGDFKLDSFVMRLANWDGDRQTVEGILSLAIGKPSHMWRDLDIERGLLVIKEWVVEFKKLELLVFSDGGSTRQLFQVVIGSGVKGTPYVGEISVLNEEAQGLDELADQVHADLLKRLIGKGMSEDRLIPLLSYLGKRVLEQKESTNED